MRYMQPQGLQQQGMTPVNTQQPIGRPMQGMPMNRTMRPQTQKPMPPPTKMMSSQPLNQGGTVGGGMNPQPLGTPLGSLTEKTIVAPQYAQAMPAQGGMSQAVMPPAATPNGMQQGPGLLQRNFG